MAITRNNTAILIEDGITSVILHKTRIVKFDNKTITLNTDGWKTATTKSRMNEVSEEFRLGFKVFQKSGQWYVEHKGASMLFGNDSITIAR